MHKKTSPFPITLPLSLQGYMVQTVEHQSVLQAGSSFTQFFHLFNL